MSSSDLLVPEGTRLVHVGPYKTGSTALQSALHEARPVLAEHGVRRAGKRHHESLAVIQATERLRAHHDADHARRAWKRLAKEIRTATEPRVVVSSEVFSQASSEQIQRIVEAFGEGVRVVLTLRPISSILPSQWQQNVLRSRQPPYEKWLERVFDADARGEHKFGTFWWPHRHDQLAERWAEIVGADNVTVIVLDPADRRMLMDTFEQMLGLPEGCLVPQEHLENRSLTAAEAELLQAYHRGLGELDVDPTVHIRLLQAGGDTALKHRKPAKGEPKPYTPPWALDAAVKVGQEMADAIAASGVRIVGDLADITRRPEDTERPPLGLTPQIAGSVMAGLVSASETMAKRTAQRELRAQAQSAPKSPTVAETPARELVREVGRRVQRRLRRS